MVLLGPTGSIVNGSRTLMSTPPISSIILTKAPKSISPRIIGSAPEKSRCVQSHEAPQFLFIERTVSLEIDTLHPERFRFSRFRRSQMDRGEKKKNQKYMRREFHPASFLNGQL